MYKIHEKTGRLHNNNSNEIYLDIGIPKISSKTWLVFELFIRFFSIFCIAFKHYRECSWDFFYVAHHTDIWACADVT